MKLRIVVRPRVWHEVGEIASYIAWDNVTAAERFRDASFKTIQGLSDWPESHRLLFPDHPVLGRLRRVYIEGFPNHMIVYRVAQDAVEVLRCLHAARDLPSAFLPRGSSEDERKEREKPGSESV